ncbi:2-oxo-4-hydroxy-4-carboxy-5-ureidoimidazoline decarboxylase [Modestobacter sp. SSW1-42]|uniref:2-oxo-4-hydroxy-4-carboxy-5-ureidoimidazoline decarboxylase n=1 Tax=Modestobacter sp. SSW1-42 TaxID=596372 RepID=UPI003986120B
MTRPGGDDALARFNDAPQAEAAEQAFGWLGVPAFAMVLTAGRPYPSVGALVSRAAELAQALSWQHVSAALDAHPRIGDRVEGASAAAEASRREQSGMADADDAVRTAIAEGNRAYEERFGHVFLVRAAGRSPEEMRRELERRLGNTPEAEQVEVKTQLVEITALRVREAMR